MPETVVRYRAAGGVVAEGDLVLVLDRPSRGEVRLPKGHVETGETAVQAGLREVAEESGFDDLEVAADLGEQTVRFTYRGKDYERAERYFLLHLISRRQVARGSKDARQFTVLWVPPDEAEALLTYEAEREWLRRARRHLDTG